jgi:hypothetical protein
MQPATCGLRYLRRPPFRPLFAGAVSDGFAATSALAVWAFTWAINQSAFTVKFNHLPLSTDEGGTQTTRFLPWICIGTCMNQYPSEKENEPATCRLQN